MPSCRTPEMVLRITRPFWAPINNMPWNPEPVMVLPATVTPVLFLTAIPCWETVACTVLFVIMELSLELSTRIPLASARATVLPVTVEFVDEDNRMPWAPGPVFWTVLPATYAEGLLLTLIAESGPR